MAYAGEERTEITLVTGCVNVETGKSACRITPGYQVLVDNTSLNIENRQVNTAFFTSWKEGVFDFDRMTLDQLCVQLSVGMTSIFSLLINRRLKNDLPVLLKRTIPCGLCWILWRKLLMSVSK